MTIQRYTDCTQLKVDQWVNLMPYASRPVQIARILPAVVEVKFYDPTLITLIPIKRKQVSKGLLIWVCDTFPEAYCMFELGQKLNEEIRIAQMKHERLVQNMVADFMVKAPQKFV